jgi:hypothetical protein
MTQDEALAKLKDEMTKKKCDAYDYLRLLDRMSRSELDASGHRTRNNAEAVRFELRRAMREIEAMMQKFERDYP